MFRLVFVALISRSRLLVQHGEF